jgi:RNA polymerase sigma-70 factor (ECF subfamily)
VSDPELLERLRAGDQNAFDSLFRTHYAQLVRVAESMLHERGSAEETVQDVMLELWRRRESLNVETSIRAYLFRATRNRALNRIRHERVLHASEPELARQGFAQPADAGAIQNEIDGALRRALEDLPARCREVFELSRVHGLKYAEIADALGISVKTVEAQMGKALRMLRERLSAFLP